MRIFLIAACLLSQGCLWALNDSRANTAFIQALALQSAKKRIEQVEEALAVRVNGDVSPVKPILAALREDLHVAEVVNEVRQVDFGPPKVKVKNHRSSEAKVLVVQDAGLAMERAKRKELPKEVLKGALEWGADIVKFIVPWWVWWLIGIAGAVALYIGYLYVRAQIAMWQQKRKQAEDAQKQAEEARKREQERDALDAEILNSMGRVATSKAALQEEMLKRPPLQAVFRRLRDAGLVFRTADREAQQPDTRGDNEEIARILEKDKEPDTTCATREGMLESVEEEGNG